jgi:hypothetical protein
MQNKICELDFRPLIEISKKLKLHVLLIFFGANFLSYESIKKSFFLEKRLKWAQELKYGVFERYTQLIFHLC